MAVAYESDGGGVFCVANNNNAITVPLPATRPVGSVLLLAAYCRLITAVAPTISGYTLLGTWTSATASGGRIWLYGRIVDGSESAPSVTPVGVTGNSGDIFAAGIVCYSGVDTSGGITNIFDGTPTTTDASGTTTCTYPALTIARSDSMIVRMLARFRDAADTFTPTATWNERADLGSTIRTGGQFHMQDKLATASGVQAAVTVAPSNTTAARYLAVTLALKPVAPTYFGAVSLPITFGKSVEGIHIPGSLYQAAVLADGPVAYWRMNESGLPQDLSPSGFHMSGSAGTTVAEMPGLLASEPTSKARGFTSGYVNRGGRLFPFNTLTAEIWVKRNRTDVTEDLFSQYNSGLALRIYNDGRIALLKSYWAVIALSVVSKILDTNPHHIVVTRNSTTNEVIFYVDGVSETVVGSADDISQSATNGFFIGSEWGAQPFDGTLDELAIYPTVLSPARVQVHYELGVGPYHAAIKADNPKAYWQLNSDPTLDISGNGNVLTPINNPVSSSSLISDSASTASRDLDGTSQYYTAIDSPSLSLSAPLTIEAWINADILSADREIVRKDPTQYWFRTAGTSLQYGYRDSANRIVATPTGILTVGTTYHVAVTDDGTTIRFYVDGAEVYNAPRPTATAAADTSGVVGVGAYHNAGTPTFFTNGRLDEVAIYGTALSPERIQAHYEAGSGPVAPKHYGSLAMPISFQSTVAGKVIQNHFGSLALPMTFAKDVAGRRRTFGQVALPVIFLKDVRGVRKTFGQLLAPFLFSKDVRGQRQALGQVSFPINVSIVTDGIIRAAMVLGATSMSVIFGKDVRAQRKTFGQTTLPLTFTKDVSGRRRTFGQLTFPIIFTKEALGVRKVLGALSMQTLFGKETAGRRRTFSQLAFPVIFSKAVSGRRKTFGQIARPINFLAVIAGRANKNWFSQLAMPVTFSKQVTAYRKTFGKTASPYIFGAYSQGRRGRLGQLTGLPIVFVANVKTGRVGVHGQIVFPIVVDFIVHGIRIRGAIILNEAEMIYLGTELVEAVYAGDEKVWPT